MRIIPRRKRTWLLALLVIVIIAAASIWQAASAKSDFERRYDQIKPGMTIQESMDVMESGLPSDRCPRFEGIQGSPHTRFAWADDGERVALDFEADRLIEKEFTPLPSIERLRRTWVRWIRSNPPF